MECDMTTTNDKVSILSLCKQITEDISMYEYRAQQTLIVGNKKHILPLLQTIKDNAEMDMLTDITAIDWLNDTNTPHNTRFELIYFLYSNTTKKRLRVKVPIDADDANCPTAEHIYPSANWYEREVWDMYGINFEGHSDMRRFYMPEDFVNPKTGEPYHPLRKDFPLTGNHETLPLPPYPERDGKEIEW